MFAVKEELETIRADCCCKTIEMCLVECRRKPANERTIYHMQDEGFLRSSIAIRRRGMHIHGELSLKLNCKL